MLSAGVAQPPYCLLAPARFGAALERSLFGSTLPGRGFGDLSAVTSGKAALYAEHRPAGLTLSSATLFEEDPRAGASMARSTAIARSRRARGQDGDARLREIA